MTAMRKDVGASTREVFDWLRQHPVPAGPSRYTTEWKSRARELGGEAIPALVEALRTGDHEVQYAAVAALRELAVEAYASGYGDDLSYWVRLPSQRRAVRVWPEGLG